MADFLDVFNMDKWRALLADFDAKRVQFVNELASLKTQKAANASLEQERQTLIAKAVPLQSQIDFLYNSLRTVRDWLKQIGGFFGTSSAQELNGLGIAPIALGISLAAAAVIVASIADWLKQNAAYNAKNKQALILLKAGASPDEINKALQNTPGTNSAKVFGFDIRWILAVGGLFLIGPWVLKKLK